VVDPEGRLLYLNEACVQLVGSPSAEHSLQYNVFALPSFVACGLDEALRLGLSGEELDLEVDYVAMFGKRAPVRIRGVPLREGEEVVAFAALVELRDELDALRDEVARLRTAAESAELELRALDRLRDRFIATVSHELRTPLVPLLGYARMLNQGRLGELTPQQAKAVRVATDNAERLLELVEKTLTVTAEGRSLRPRETEPLDVRALLTEAAETMEPVLAKHGLTIEIDTPARLPPVLGNHVKLSQVLLALVDNARKHTPAGGRVVLAAAPDGDERVALEVADTGESVPEAERARIFEPFHQAASVSSRRRGGIGLGLTIVREVVTAHGGLIELVEREGFGAVFRVELPRATERPVRQDPSSMEVLHIRVLLLDEDERRREVLATLLAAHGYLVRTARLGDDLDELLDRWTPAAIVLGLEPEGALDLLHVVRQGETRRLIPVFVLAAEGEHVTKRAALDAGATAVLLEPLDEAWLLRLMAAVYPTFL